MHAHLRSSALSLGLLLAACTGSDAQADMPRAMEASPPAYADLLARHATPDGVRHAAWRASPEDMEKLRAVVAFFAGTLPPEGRDASLAWHLNAYNAWTLHNILKKHPTKGPLDGDPLFFHGNRITLSGEKTSLDHLEQKVIRPAFGEPRIHFALNCASESCPPLQARPFAAATLEADLDRLTRAFINDNPRGVVAVNTVAKLSKIFDWYADDFGGKDRLIPYINRHRDQPLPRDAKLEFLDYSWKLNEAR